MLQNIIKKRLLKDIMHNYWEFELSEFELSEFELSCTRNVQVYKYCDAIVKFWYNFWKQVFWFIDKVIKSLLILSIEHSIYNILIKNTDAYIFLC